MRAMYVKMRMAGVLQFHERVALAGSVWRLGLRFA